MSITNEKVSTPIHVGDMIHNWLTAYECGIIINDGTTSHKVVPKSEEDACYKRRLLVRIQEALEKHHGVRIPIVTDLEPFWHETCGRYEVSGFSIIACDSTRPIVCRGHVWLLCLHFADVTVQDGDAVVAYLSGRAGAKEYGSVRTKGGNIYQAVHASVHMTAERLTGSKCTTAENVTAEVVIDNQGERRVDAVGTAEPSPLVIQLVRRRVSHCTIV